MERGTERKAYSRRENLGPAMVQTVAAGHDGVTSVVVTKPIDFQAKSIESGT